MVSLVTSTLTTKTKEQDRLRMENEKVKMRANLLRSVSHDIRTPLTSIMGATSAVLENPALSQAEQHDLLEDVRDDAQWLIRVVENLLSITRIGDDQAKITKEPEAAEEVLGEAVRKFRKRFPVRLGGGPRARTSCCWSPWTPSSSMQVLSNLLENAVVPRGDHHPHRPVCPAGRALGPLFRAGQRPAAFRPRSCTPCSTAR